MHRARQLVFTVVLCGITNRIALAQQAGAAPMQVECRQGPPLNCGHRIRDSVPTPNGKDTTQYISIVHEVALRGITFTDSTAIQRAVFRQADEVWRKAGKAWQEMWAAAKGKKYPTAEEAEANLQLHRELFDRLLPELRPLVPPAQQATFDENLQALRESKYTLVNMQENRALSLPYLVACFAGCP